MVPTMKNCLTIVLFLFLTWIPLEEVQAINGLIKKDSVLLENRVQHEFSNLDKKDEFYVCLVGESILDATVVFTITNSDGVEIFREEFPSVSLIGYDLPGGIDASTRDQQNFIKYRVRHFFDEKNFFIPAIKSDQEFDEDYSDKEIWNEIKSDQKTRGFYYSIGEEDGRKIAYSKRLKKVVQYFNCC